MEKVTLKLSEFYQLDAELNGFVNPQTGEKLVNGLLNEKIKLTTKYWLSDLGKKVATEKEAIEKLKEELIKKHGEADKDGNIQIAYLINEEKDENGKVISGELNPKYVEFQKDFNTLLEETREIECKTFKLEEFENVETSDKYETFFKLVKPGE